MGLGGPRAVLGARVVVRRRPVRRVLVHHRLYPEKVLDAVGIKALQVQRLAGMHLEQLLHGRFVP